MVPDASALPPSGCSWHACCPSRRQRASDSAKSALTVQPQTVLARQLPRSGVPRAAHQTAAVRPVRGLRCTRCAQRSAVVRRRGARRASGLMQLCPRCFRDLRASETACGRGWRARRARATHSRLDGSKRSVFRGPLKSPALLALLAAKMMPLILGHLLCSNLEGLLRLRLPLLVAHWADH